MRDALSTPKPNVQQPPKVTGYALQSRYIGAYLLYGAGTGWHRPASSARSQVYALRYERSGPVRAIPLDHAVDRIEALGADAVVVGSDGNDLHFTSLRLNGSPEVADSYVRKNAAQGETRSHGFYYKAENEQEGLLGLPMIGGRDPGSRQLRAESAALLYLRNNGLSLSELGTLDAHPNGSGRNDGCRASCATGTAIPGRSSFAGVSSRYSATRSWKAQSRIPGLSKLGESTSPPLQS